MRILSLALRTTLLGILGSLWLLAGVYLYFAPDLPDAHSLRDVRLQTPMQVFTRNGHLIGQFGEQKRNPLTFEQIPATFIQALLAAEDDRFFEHRGVDLAGLLRAVSELLLTGEKGSGGSTLTMQVARNYFLSLERTFTRKFREILLAIEIERALTKEEIFELYVNRVFLGHRAYGFEAAAQVYYGRSLDQLSVAQQAMLAGIPKAPSRNNPISGPEAALERRNWILGRMLNLGYIDRDMWRDATREVLTASHHEAQLSFSAHYAAEMARQEMLDRYGMAAYSDGLKVYTSIDSRWQQAARKALLRGLATYDRRHGYRGPEKQLPPGPDEGQTAVRARWLAALERTPTIAGMRPAVVTAVGDREQGVELLLAPDQGASLNWGRGLQQASPYLNENARGKAPESPAEVVSVGDLIRVREHTEGGFELTQVPKVQGALVSLDPNNGAIRAIVGGMGFEHSKFNRATQARRQPGSAFKPFVYAAALDAGYTAASIINDAPIVFEDTSLEDIWRPENDSGHFYGPTRLRWALTKSRNLVSIRLLQQMGVGTLLDYLAQLGFVTEAFSRDLSLALGTHVMTPLDLASAYALLANSGYAIEPWLVERVEDARGRIIYRANAAAVCRHCASSPGSGDEEQRELSMEEILAGGSKPPAQTAPRVMDERDNFILTSMLQDVIKHGTGRRALALGRDDLAGKTGTTNGPMDAWFAGYNADVATTVWVGFDNYTPLGRREFGGTAALPIWIDFMAVALEDSPERSRPMPAGVVNVRIDPETGRLARPGQADAIFEYFREDRLPEIAEQGDDSATRNSAELLREIF